MLNLLRDRPLFAQFAITYRCNSRCQSCEYWCRQSPERELALEEMPRLADELWRFGIRVLTVTGGEPFLRTDAPDIIRLFQKKGFRVTINTNGICLDEGLLRELSARDRLHIVVSLDSLDPKLYANIRGIDALDKVLAAMSSLKDRTPHEVRAFTLVSGHNVHEVPQLLEFCRENGYRLSAYPVMSGTRGKWFAPNQMIAPDTRERIAEAFDWLARQSRRDRTLFGFSGVYQGAASFLRGNPVGRCGAGRVFLQVSPDGKVSACPEMTPFCDITKERLSDAYLQWGWRADVKRCHTATPCYIGCTRMLQSIRNSPFRFLAENGAKRLIGT